MFKKTILFALVTVILLNVLGISVSATDIMPCDSSTVSCSSSLTFSGSTATCTSKAIGYYGETTKIVISQSLQKKTSSGSWSSIASWSETSSDYKGSATNTKSNLSSGTYRLRTVFKVYSGTSYETVEKTSSEVTV